MSYWSRWRRGGSNSDLPMPRADSPGDPNGAELLGEQTFSRSMPRPIPTPWNGLPADWHTDWAAPAFGLNKLIDTAWTCIDLNAMVLSSMPVYLLRNGEVSEPKTWMINPDPLIYTGWPEFAKQVFWDYQLGEVFILSLSEGADNRTTRMRVIPPWLVNVELSGGTRVYSIGSEDVTGHMLHIRYQSSTVDMHGHGPLEMLGARLTTAGLLQSYAERLARTGGIPHYWIGVDKFMNQDDAETLLDVWVESRMRRLGEPALLTNGATLNLPQSMSAKEMALLEIAQFTESRIAVACGVPPFLVGLPGPGGLTYANEAQLFDFHDRSSLGPKAVHVMTALSNWATTRPNTLELNRDDYSRPDFAVRTEAEVKLVQAGAMSIPELRVRERFNGPRPGALVGNDQAVVDQSATDQVKVNQAAAGRNGNALQGN